MIKKKKYPKINPLFVKDQKGEKVEVILKYNVYESIIDEMNDLKKKISALKKKSVTKR